MIFFIGLIILLLWSSERVSADTLPIEFANHAALDRLPLFYPGQWNYYTHFTLYDLEGEPCAYAIVYLKRGAKPKTLKELEITMKKTRERISLLHSSIKQILSDEDKSGEERNEKIVSLHNEINMARRVLFGKDFFTTVITGTKETMPIILKCYEGLPTVFVQKTDALELLEKTFPNEQWEISEFLYLGTFNEVLGAKLTTPTKTNRRNYIPESVVIDLTTQGIHAKQLLRDKKKKHQKNNISIDKDNLWNKQRKNLITSLQKSTSTKNIHRKFGDYSKYSVVQNEIPGASDNPSSVPTYLNNRTMYPIPGHPPNLGICWATAMADILAYWDRNPYNDITYWNLVENGKAPLLQNILPVAPGHAEADVKSLIVNLGTRYYVDYEHEDLILETICNSKKNLSFNIVYYEQVFSFSEKEFYINKIIDEINAGRPIGLASYGNIFGGPHEIPTIGYICLLDDQTSYEIYVHTNTGSNQSEYVNIFDPAWGALDMIAITPGGAPNDQYEELNGVDDDEKIQAKWIYPEDNYGFRQTHNFRPGSLDFGDDKQDWTKFNALKGRRYMIETENLGSRCDTQLYLEWDGSDIILFDDDGGPETGASMIVWECLNNTIAYVLTKEKIGRVGHDTNYDIKVRYEGIFLCGDADGNGTVDIFDALLAAEFDAGLKGPEDFPDFLTFDVDGNQTIDIFDALMIAEFSARLRSGLCNS